MNLRDFLPPVAVRAMEAVAKSFASDWVRGRDLDSGGSAARRVRFVEPYAQSAWVRAAVNQISGPISSRPLHFYRGEQRLADAALAAWWQAPALGPRSLGAQARLPLPEVLRDLAAWDAYEGEFFLVLGDEWLTTGGRALGAGLPPFMIAHPQRMQAIVMGGVLSGWRYVDGGRVMTFVPEQVIHAKGWNPHDDWRGVGGMQAARIAAEGAFLTGAYLRDLARNNGDQGFVVVAKSGVVNEQQREQITADLRAKRAALARGEARDLLLGGDITIDRPKEEAASGELVASLGLSQQEVFVAFEVPPSRAAVKQAYSIGKESDTYQLITERCMPLGHRIAAAFARVAQLQTGLAIEAELEWDDHPVMIEVRNSRIEAMGRLCDRGMPVKHASEYLQLGMKAFPGWEVGYLPFSVAPVSAAGDAPATDPAADPALAEPADQVAEDPAVAQLRLLLLTRARAARPVCRAEVPPEPDAFAAFACTCGEGAPAATKARDPKEIAQWRTLMAKRRETVKSMTSALGRVLMQARVETLRRIDDQLSGKCKSVAKAAVADLLFDLTKFAASMRDVMAAQHRRGLDLAGQQLFDELAKSDPFTYPPEAVVAFLRQRENRLRDVPQEIYDRVKASIEEALQGGETTAQIAGRVKAEFNTISDGQARTIALTETAAVYGAGRAQAMVQAGVQWKQWLTSGNANVRAAHAAANGQTVRIDESFVVDGEMLRHPGDSTGSAGNVINCHCVSIAVASGPEA